MFSHYAELFWHDPISKYYLNEASQGSDGSERRVHLPPLNAGHAQEDLGPTPATSILKENHSKKASCRLNQKKLYKHYPYSLNMHSLKIETCDLVC